MASRQKRKQRLSAREEVTALLSRVPILLVGHITPGMLDKLELAMLRFPQIDVPVKHTFAEGVYIREGTMPPGIFLGHSHLHDHLCVVKSGRMSLVNPDRSLTEIKGPCHFMGRAGRKLVIVHEAVTMQNIHSTVDWREKSDNPEVFEDFLYHRTPASVEAKRKTISI